MDRADDIGVPTLETSMSRRLIFIPLSPVVGSSVAEDEDPAQRGVEVVRYVSVNQRRILPAPVTRLPQLVIPHREPGELKWISFLLQSVERVDAQIDRDAVVVPAKDPDAGNSHL